MSDNVTSENETSHPFDAVPDEEINRIVDELVRDAVCVSCGSNFTTTKPERRFCLWCEAKREIQEAREA